MTKVRPEAAAALVWGAAEGLLFFIVPDVVIGWIALRRGLRAGLIAALLAALGATVGGSALWAWSQTSPTAALAAVRAVPAVSDAMVERARSDIALDGWFRAALAGPLTGTPYKVYAVLAPQAGVGLAKLAIDTAPLRLPRFALTAAGLALAGALVRRRFGLGAVASRAATLVYAGGWLVFYGWFFAAHPG